MKTTTIWTVSRDRTTVAFSDFPGVAFVVNDIDDVIRAWRLSRRWRWELPFGPSLLVYGVGL